MCRAANLRPAVTAVDHLLLGVSDLDRGIAWVEERTGVRAAAGGSHPGRGTRNALLSLGGRHYLEIIAPDPAQSTFNFQIDVRTMATPRLITWAASTTDIDAAAKSARDAGLQAMGPMHGSRQTLSGTTLKWRTLGIAHSLRAGALDPIPFFIQWGADTRHPSVDSPAGCELESLRFEHPDPQALVKTLRSVSIEANAAKAGNARIIAKLRTRKGAVELA